MKDYTKITVEEFRAFLDTLSNEEFAEVIQMMLAEPIKDEELLRKPVAVPFVPVI